MIKQHVTSDQVLTPNAATLRLPHRAGERPATTSTNPHSQLDQRPDPTTVRNMIAAAVNLPGVEAGPSMRAQAGTIGLYLKPEAARGGEEAFLLGREFAHVHPLPDGSLHLTLPSCPCFLGVRDWSASMTQLRRYEGTDR
jgi:hypothetical protein